MVLQTHASYPVGHLSTMYWIGLREATYTEHQLARLGQARLEQLLCAWNAGDDLRLQLCPLRRKEGSRCARTTRRDDALRADRVRMLILEDLRQFKTALREAVGAGEPLNPEVIERVREAWGVTIRDGYGQTETTAMFGNSPRQAVKVGSLGRPLPGFEAALLNADGHFSDDGEVVVALDTPPTGLMAGYVDSPMPVAEADGRRWYRTFDVASRTADGWYWFLGRADDVFKSSDYRISPFELESVLIEHECVAEAAVVPSPDAVRLAVPKAFVVLKPGFEPTRATATAIFSFLRGRLAPYKRVRRIESSVLFVGDLVLLDRVARQANRVLACEHIIRADHGVSSAYPYQGIQGVHRRCRRWRLKASRVALVVNDEVSSQDCKHAASAIAERVLSKSRVLDREAHRAKQLWRLDKHATAPFDDIQQILHGRLRRAPERGREHLRRHLPDQRLTGKSGA